MKISHLSAGLVISALFLSFAPVHTVHAYTAPNLNEGENFRRARGLLIRYERNKRSIYGAQDTGTGSLSTFDRRADALRKAQLERIKEDIEQRKFTGERRNTPHYWDRYNRTTPTTLRRINQAEEEGGIRHGLPPKRTNQQIEQLQYKRQLQQDYRKNVLERQKAQRDAINKSDASECGELTGRRYALCLYQLQRDS